MGVVFNERMVLHFSKREDIGLNDQSYTSSLIPPVLYLQSYTSSLISPDTEGKSLPYIPPEKCIDLKL